MRFAQRVAILISLVCASERAPSRLKTHGPGHGNRSGLDGLGG